MSNDMVVDKEVFDVPAAFRRGAWVSSMEQYAEMYRRSIEDGDAFWAEVAERVTWFKTWDTVQNHDFAEAKIRWFEGGKLNVAYNCLDRHLDTAVADKVAFYWEGDSPGSERVITYRQLWEDVTKFANVLKKHGVKKGDRVTIYLPMIPELPVAMLACARIGAIHSVVFGGFSAEALRDRILDCASNILITADGGLRGGKNVPLEGGRRPGDGVLPRGQDLHRGAPHRPRRTPMGRGPRHLVPRRAGRSRHHDRLPVRGDGRRGPAVHPLHVRFHRASPRACCTPPPATWSTRATRTR